jgi:hypothetical protein
MVGGMSRIFCVVLVLVPPGAQTLSRSTHDFPSALNLGISNTSRLRGTESSQVSVAVVGSGPISETDRALIKNAMEIYRFNSMNNLRKAETVGTVFLRRGGNGLLSGIPPSSGSCPLLEHANALRIVMDPGPGLSPAVLADLRSRWPSVEIIDEKPNTAAEIDGRFYFPNAAGWSSGFVGVSHVLKHSPLVQQGHKVHIFGMNWKHTSVLSGGHPWMHEKEVLMNAKSIVIHPANTFNYKPRDSTGKMMWMCEGGYSFLLKNLSPVNASSAQSNSSIFTSRYMKDHSFGLESNDDGTFTVVVGNTSSPEYLVGDGRLSSDKAEGVKVEIADGSFELTLGKDTYKMIGQSM